MRVEILTGRVKCFNKECEDYDVVRVIELPHLGDGVFLKCSVPGPIPFLPPVANLICGTCMTTNIGDALVPSDHAADHG